MPALPLGALPGITISAAAAIFPPPADVLDTAASYGPTGGDYTGIYHAPAATEVISSAWFGVSSGQRGLFVVTPTVITTPSSTGQRGLGSMPMGRFLTVTASTKRAPAIAGGKRGAAVTQVVTLQCTPLDPVDPELRQRLALNTPHTLRQAYTEMADIEQGDILVVAGVDYPIRSCAEWEWRGTAFLHLIIEDLKR
jgi:hypothetical protein